MKSNIALLAATAFAAAAPVAKAGAPKAEDRIAPVFTPVVANIPLPISKRNSGVRSALLMEVDKLEVNHSLGLTNKTKKQISSMISKHANRKENLRPKLNADGTAAMKPGEPIKDANGVQIGLTQAVAEMEKIKEFEVHDMDPKTDPQKATVRIFRTK